MKKLLIATTALVATAGMASADITISGHAAAGIYSGLGNKDAVAAYKGVDVSVAASSTTSSVATDGTLTKGTMTAAVGKASVAANHTVVGDEATYKTNVLKAKAALAAALIVSGSDTKTAAEIADLELDVAEAESNLAVVNSVAK